MNESEKKVPEASLSDVRFGEVINEVPFDKEKLAGKVVVVEVWGGIPSRMRPMP